MPLPADKNEAGSAEYFEMYVGPITSLYSQVWWTGLPKAFLPKDIVQRFVRTPTICNSAFHGLLSTVESRLIAGCGCFQEGKGMAIIGYEVDQVRKKGDKDVDGSILQEDVSVPINVSQPLDCLLVALACS